MKGTGKIIKLMEEVSFGMFMETLMRVNGREIKHMVKENILIAMVLLIKETGVTIFSMDKALNIGTTTQNTKGSIRKVKNTDRVPTHGRMVLSILESGLKTKYMVEANTHGMMDVSMKANGKIITWMVTEFILGKMGECTRVTIRKIKSTVKEFILGPMAENMMGNGKTAGNMASESTFPNKDNIEREFGKMGREKDGLMKLIDIFSHPLFEFKR